LSDLAPDLSDAAPDLSDAALDPTVRPTPSPTRRRAVLHPARRSTTSRHGDRTVATVVS